MIFALCAFALGFTEFVSIGLVANISEDLRITLSQSGWSVMAYASGAFIGAPFLTALTARWSGKRVLMMAMTLFTLGNLDVCLSGSLIPLLAGRFISGLGHGVFLAVASTTATRLVVKEKAGSAISIVFGGLTVALALGVPLGTYAGNLLGWRSIFAVIAATGAISFVALMFSMSDELANVATETRTFIGLTALFKPRLLASASITVLAYAGAFTFYTFISPTLLQITGLTEKSSSAILMVYGVMAALGNIVGGKLSDRKGADYAAMTILIGLLIVLAGIWQLQSFTWAMVILIGVLGALTYAAVPALQARVIAISDSEAVQFPEVASGINIAGFNGGIALGSIIGGLSLQWMGLRSIAATGAFIIMSGIAVMAYQMVRASAIRSQITSNAEENV